MKFEEEQNNINAYKYIKKILKEIKNEKVIVSDGDETISIKDTSKIFFEKNELQDIWIKNREIFKTYGRNYESYAEVANSYTSFKYLEYIELCKNIFDDIKIRDYWNKVVNTNLKIIIVTSGLEFLWRYIAKKNNWNNVIVIGGNNYNEHDFVISPKLKGEIINLLKINNNNILTFGDSMVDFEMLVRSDISVAVINERNSPGLIEKMRDNNNFYELDEKYLINDEKVKILTIDEILDEFKKYN